MLELVRYYPLQGIGIGNIQHAKTFTAVVAYTTCINEVLNLGWCMQFEWECISSDLKFGVLVIHGKDPGKLFLTFTQFVDVEHIRNDLEILYSINLFNIYLSLLHSLND